MKKRRITVQVRLSLEDCVVLEMALVEYAKGNLAYLDLLTRLNQASLRAQEQEKMRSVP